MYLLIFATFLLFLALTLPLFPKSHRIFLLVFSISTIYYGIGGPWFWTTQRAGIFIGVDWNDVLPDIPYIFIGIHLIVAGTLLLLTKTTSSTIKFHISNPSAKRIYWIEYFGLFIGGIAASYVYIKGGQVIESGGRLGDDGILQIAYQFSDLIIAILLFRFADNRFSKFTVAIFLLFIAYAIIVGMRYKILLLIAPMLTLFYFQPNKNQFAIRIAMLSSALLLVTAFGLMTISRQKFIGINYDAISGATLEDFLFGLFADSNIIFGLSSALEQFGQKTGFVGMQPILDTIIQFVPRAIYPEKDLYQHLVTIQWGLGGTAEALSSGTAPPFFAEYFAMGGWPAVWVGCIGYVVTTHVLLQTANGLSTPRHSLVCVGLIAVYFGYYYFSRGSIAQISKGFLFICIPFIYLSNCRRALNKLSDDLKSKRTSDPLMTKV